MKSFTFYTVTNLILEERKFKNWNEAIEYAEKINLENVGNYRKMANKILGEKQTFIMW